MFSSISTLGFTRSFIERKGLPTGGESRMTAGIRLLATSGMRLAPSWCLARWDAGVAKLSICCAGHITPGYGPINRNIGNTFIFRTHGHLLHIGEVEYRVTALMMPMVHRSMTPSQKIGVVYFSVILDVGVRRQLLDPVERHALAVVAEALVLRAADDVSARRDNDSSVARPHRVAHDGVAGMRRQLVESGESAKNANNSSQWLCPSVLSILVNSHQYSPCLNIIVSTAETLLIRLY